METKDDIKIHEEPITFSLNGKMHIGYFSYDENQKGTRPGILVVPEWWGLNDYTRSRAKQLAELGYAAMAIDIYGGGEQGNTPPTALALATPFHQNPALGKPIIDAAIDKLKSMPHVDAANIAAIGYCFGGYILLNAVKLGADLKGMVSFHGGLQGVPPNKDLIKAKILVCHGDADEYDNPHLPKFKQDMADANIDYDLKVYADATHAFTNPVSTEKGIEFNIPIEYNEAADKDSWNDMKVFFKVVFGK
ncbi:MAG: dienelactone hydrolase family protein [Ginsengibacter sp.]